MTAPPPIWLQIQGSGCILNLHIQPGAKKTEVTGEHGDALKIRLAAPPVDGKANTALLAFLGKKLGLPKAALRIKSGDTSRHKRVEVDLEPAAIIAVLQAL